MTVHDDPASGAPAAGQDLGWPLGTLEMRVLRAVWARGRATVRDILSDVTATHPVAYTTVMTVMSRLAEKSVLRRELVGKTHWYTASLTPEAFAAAVSQRVLHSLVAEFGDLAIVQFAAELQRIDPERLGRLRNAAQRRGAP